MKRIRKHFERSFNAFSRNSLPLESIPEEHRAGYLEFRTLKFCQVGFSDSFVIGIPLINDKFGADRNAIAVKAALHGIAVITLVSMASGIPLRGGIDVERGLELFANEVYGPVLINAYNLESTVAEYPRIAIGSGLLQYLSWLERASTTGLPNTFTTRQALECRQLICEAPDDGQPMLHILSPAVIALNPRLRELFPRLHSWVIDEIGRHRAAGNGKLERRYRRLLLYLMASGIGESQGEQQVHT